MGTGLVRAPTGIGRTCAGFARASTGGMGVRTKPAYRGTLHPSGRSANPGDSPFTRPDTTLTAGFIRASRRRRLSTLRARLQARVFPAETRYIPLDGRNQARANPVASTWSSLLHGGGTARKTYGPHGASITSASFLRSPSEPRANPVAAWHSRRAIPGMLIVRHRRGAASASKSCACAAGSMGLGGVRRGCAGKSCGFATGSCGRPAPGQARAFPAVSAWQAVPNARTSVRIFSTRGSCLREPLIIRGQILQMRTVFRIRGQILRSPARAKRGQDLWMRGRFLWDSDSPGKRGQNLGVREHLLRERGGLLRRRGQNLPKREQLLCTGIGRALACLLDH